MEPNIFRYVLKYSIRQQLWIMVLTFCSFPFLYYSLELPKLIVNKAIDHKDFPIEYHGYLFEQKELLFILSGLFFFSVIFNGALKYYMNIYKGKLGELLLRRLRYQLYSRILRFPIERLKYVSPSEMIPIITAELEPLGNFIGDIISLPLFQGGTLLVYLVFIFLQDPVLGAAAISLYPFQAYLIPKLQKRINALVARRIRTTRTLSDHIGESITMLPEIHTSGTTRYHLADISFQLGKIFFIRFDIFKLKYFMKFINNFLNQLTPFFFYAIGGYLVIQGRISLGSLIAVLAAYKDLAGPWKELLAFYQQKEDIRIRYQQVIQLFNPPDLLPPLLSHDRPLLKIKGMITFTDITLEQGHLKNISCKIDTQKHTALIGEGALEFASLLGHLHKPQKGKIDVQSKNYFHIPSEQIAYISAQPNFLNLSLIDNLVYGLKVKPQTAPFINSQEYQTAKISGNTTDPINTNWINYKRAGVKDAEELHLKIKDLIHSFDLSEDIFQFGLKGNPPELSDKIIQARQLIHSSDALDDKKFTPHLSLGENIIFGTFKNESLTLDQLGHSSYFKSILDKTGLTSYLIKTGLEISKLMDELFKDLNTKSQLFETYSFMTRDELPLYQRMIHTPNTPKAKTAFMILALRLIPSKHRLDFLDSEIEDKTLKARQLFHDHLPQTLSDKINVFNLQKINPQLSVEENIFFRKLTHQTFFKESTSTLLEKTIQQVDGLYDEIFDLGLKISIGPMGSTLNAIQKQKCALIRGLIKNPDLFIVASQGNIPYQKLHELRSGQNMICVLQDTSQKNTFDQTLFFEKGALL